MSTTVHVLPHTHWDREWFVPSSFTREWLVPFFSALFERFREDEEYRFTLDGQSILLEDYLAQLTSRARRDALVQISQLVRDGRLTIGPYYQQPDWQLVSGESLVRNLLLGVDDTAALGASEWVGWLMDNFGQISQCVQLHHQFGIRSVFAWRGFDLLPDRVRSELVWAAPDGSRLPVIYLVDSYRNGMRLFSHPELLHRRIAHAVRRVAPFSTDHHLLLMNGYDQEMEPELPDRSATIDGGTIRLSSPLEYVAAKQSSFSGQSVPVVDGMQYSGRFISIFPGVLSARVYLKTANSLAQTMQERYLEPLSVLAVEDGNRDADVREELELLWRMILQNHPHDTICGVSSDPVHEEAEIRFSEIHRRQMKLFKALCRRLVPPPADGSGNPVYFNPSPYYQRAPISSGVGPKLPPFSLMTVPNSPPADGDLIPVRVEQREYALHLENGLVRAILREDGTISISGSSSAPEPGAAVELTWRDVGDAGDTYNFDQPIDETPTRVVLSGGALIIEHTSPAHAVISVTGSFRLPTELVAGRRSRDTSLVDNPTTIRVELRADDDLVYCTMEMEHTSRDHRFQMVTTVLPPGDYAPPAVNLRILNQFHWDDADEASADLSDVHDADLSDAVRALMIGAREPGAPTSLPTDRGFLLEGSHGGALVVHRGLHELERILPGTVALTIVRAVGWLARPDLESRTGDAGPEIFTPDAQCRRRLSVRWAVSPIGPGHGSGTIENYHIMAKVERFFAPPVIVGESNGSMVRSIIPDFSLTDETTLGVSACKISEDGTRPVLRLFNPGRTPAAISFPQDVIPLTAAEHPTDQVSHRRQEVEPGHIATFGLPPFSSSQRGMPLPSRRDVTPEERFRFGIDHHVPDCSFGLSPYQMPVDAWAIIAGVNHGGDRLAAARTERDGSYVVRILENENARRQRLLEQHDAAEQEVARASSQRERVLAEARVSTLHRQILEVDLSILFARRRAGLEQDLATLRDRVRDIALKLNHARVTKRTHDYHVALVQSNN